MRATPREEPFLGDSVTHHPKLMKSTETLVAGYRHLEQALQVPTAC
ncbi:MAG: hypothetical protein P8N09_02690 [Planctomycetota bacterium]|nr:hypothetical protein [Planctomycetota bacterium]